MIAGTSILGQWNRESVGLVGLGVGQRQGVAAAAVKGVRQVHDLGAQVSVAPGRFVLPTLPVEGDLEGVFDGQRPALDEEQVGERGSPSTRTNVSTNSA